MKCERCGREARIRYYRPDVRMLLCGPCSGYDANEVTSGGHMALSLGSKPK